MFPSTKIIFSLLLLVGLYNIEMAQVGGLSPVKDATNSSQVAELVHTVRPFYEKHSNQKCHVFTPLEYRTQIVNGLNYFIKVLIGEDDCIHLRVYKPRTDPPALQGVLTGKTVADPLQYFDKNID